MADEFNWSDFIAIGFSHHIEIITKAKSLDARLFYIHESATRFWNKYTLRDYLKADLYNHRGTLPNNFTATMPSTKQALVAISFPPHSTPASPAKPTSCRQAFCSHKTPSVRWRR